MEVGKALKAASTDDFRVIIFGATFLVLERKDGGMGSGIYIPEVNEY